MIQVVHILFSAFALIQLLASTAAASNKPCIAARMDDLSTVWLGETLGEYFRLQIDPDGTGLLTAQWVLGKAAKAYKVTETNLADRRVGFRLESLDSPSESLYLRGTACRGLLDLQVGSNSPKWKLEVIFQPQARLIERQQAVTKRAEEYAAQRLPQPDLPQLDETARLIAALEKLDPSLYFDMHGNAHDQLQALMIARFSATAGITQTIDRLESTKERSELVGALYDALGFVKDPASIPWLRSKVGASDPNPFYTRYLPKWRDMPEGYGTWEWLEGRDRWIELFVWTFGQVHNETRRTEILEVLSGFDDPSVRTFFNAQNAATLSPRERLVVATYLHFHGGSPNEQRIQDAIDSLAGESRNRQFLIEAAHHLRHPAFVPFLISIADDQPDKYSRESLWNAQDALEKITFQVGAKGKAQWEQWYGTYGRAGREKWLERALEAMRRMIRENEKEAVKFFDRAVYSWDDIALLSFVEDELAPRAAFRDTIAGWINLTYRPVYRSRLESLAKKIAGQSRSLAPWARRLLVERGFLPPGPKSTWREYVRASNMRV